jgi:enoyl-CoA hydratase/carnithine racemase
MGAELKIEFEIDYFKSSKIGSLIILELKDDAFKALLNIEENIELLNWFDLAGDDKSVKGILVLGDKNCFCDEAYARHLSALTGEYIDPERPRIVKKIIDNRKRSIQINMLNSFIKKFISLPKMVFVSLTGCVVSPMWGLSLAADYRIASPDLMIHLNSKEFGLHPSGGVPFFMSKQIGLSTTQEILYTVKHLNAETVRDLGLINRLTSEDNYRNDVIGIASEILDSTSYDYFYYTKQLINHRLLKEFELYSDLEYKMELH